MKINLIGNTLICGNNLEWLEWIDDDSIDLCYIDPPFFSQRDYKTKDNVDAFTDKFDNVSEYINWMKLRINLIYKKLKQTGSIFLHCDWHACHRIRCMLEEKDLFGIDNFKNEIIWSYQRWTAASNSFQRTHDNILFYSKSSDSKFYPLLEDYSIKSKHKSARFSKLQDGKLEQQYTEDSSRKKSMRDVWDISVLNSQSKERIGYPTQKPEALIRRIIQCASNENDLVLDCFSGSGTTAKVCRDINRRFIVGDVSPLAVQVCASRLHQSGFFNFEIVNTNTGDSEFLWSI